MKRVLAVVACGSLHLAPCQASSGWGAAGSATGAGGSWPSVPPDGPPDGPPQGPPADEQSTGQHPLDPTNYYHTNAARVGEGFDAAGNGGTGGYHEPHTYHHDQQQQQQQHQLPPYERSYIPQQSRWAGQHRQQQQQHQRQQQQFPQHEGYPPPSGGSGSYGTGQPLHLGTKWRNMVSRVKDAVRPGQPPPVDYGQAGGEYQAGYGGGGGGGGGGWAEGGGGAGGYSPPGSSWVGAASQNERYGTQQGMHSGQTRPSTNPGYGGDSYAQQQQQQQQPYGGGGSHPPAGAAAAAAAADYGGFPPGGSDGAAVPFDTQGQQHHAPPPQTYVDGADSSAQPLGPSQQAPAQATNSYGESNVDGSGTGHGYRNEGAEGYGGSGGSGGSGGGGDHQAGLVGSTMSEGQRVAVGGGLPAREPSFEPQQPATTSAAVGQGWSTPGADPPAPPIVIPEQVPAATSGGAAHGNGGAMAPVPNGSAWSPLGGQSGGVQDDGLDTAGSAPPGESAVATPPESGVQPSESAAATGAFGGGGSSYGTNHGTVGSLDTMPSSADHGMEKVDWGKGAEETEEGTGAAAEGESGETVVVPGSEERLELEREEQALIRELERMDSSIENGDNLLGAGGEGMGAGASSSGGGDGSSSLTSPAPAPAPSEDQAMIDEAVEHQLDDIFDSIILDEDIDADFEVDIDADSADAAAAAAAAAEGGGYTLVAHDRPAMPSASVAGATEYAAGEDWDLFDGGTADMACERQPASPWQGAQTDPSDSSRAPGKPQPRTHEGNAPPTEATSAADSGWCAATNGAEGAPMPGASAPPLAAAQSAAATVPEAEAAGGPSGSLWGSTNRWDSLPPQPSADISESGEEEEEEVKAELVVGGEYVQDFDGVDDEDEADVRVPLDPIELPPSAATDEIWNDQHLQDQLDAYWEQSRRGAAAGAGGAGARLPPSGVQQLSAYGSGEPHLQPTYGPGDWVGGRGGGALLPEPLPGSAAPRLFQGGNQAPINIYGNVHVHLQQGGADQQQQQGAGREGRPSAELSARERYYSQGETSWSGSERGGQ